jgi:hypothetical protein
MAGQDKGGKIAARHESSWTAHPNTTRRDETIQSKEHRSELNRFSTVP